MKFDKSGYAALGWSVVSFGLQVAAHAEEAREFVLSSSEAVTGFLERYARYEKWFRGPQPDKEFDQHLTKVYKAILLYVMALEDYLQHIAGSFAEFWMPESNHTNYGSTPCGCDS